MCFGGGGSGTSKKQLDIQNKLQQQAFDLMKASQQKVSDAVSQYLSGNVGFDPEQLALLKSQFLNSTAQNYQTAGQNVRTALLRSGSLDSSTPAGGDAVRGIAGLEGGLASTTSSGLANIDLQNLAQALSNRFNAASLINGQAAQLTSPISTFGSGANNALSNYVQAQQSTFGNMLGRNLGGAFGTVLGAGLGGGFGNLLSKLPGFGTSGPQGGGSCWIAEELYGVDSPNTHTVRAWLNNEYSKTAIGSVVMALYRRFGKKVALLVRKHKLIRKLFKPLFDAALTRASV